MPEQLLLSRRQAALTLNLSLRTIDYLLARNEIRSVRVGRRRLIAQSELDRFIRRDHPAPAGATLGVRS